MNARIIQNFLSNTKKQTHTNQQQQQQQNEKKKKERRTTTSSEISSLKCKCIKRHAFSKDAHKQNPIHEPNKVKASSISNRLQEWPLEHCEF